MDFSHHFIDIVFQFVYIDFVGSGNENARAFFISYPAILQFFKAPVPFLLRFKRILIVFLVFICVYLIENNISNL